MGMVVALPAKSCLFGNATAIVVLESCSFGNATAVVVATAHACSGAEACEGVQLPETSPTNIAVIFSFVRLAVRLLKTKLDGINFQLPATPELGMLAAVRAISEASNAEILPLLLASAAIFWLSVNKIELGTSVTRVIAHGKTIRLDQDRDASNQNILSIQMPG